MSNVPVPFYYNQYTAKERSYVDYMGEINNSISSEIERNANKQIAANALFAGEIKSTLISNQIATETALYNHTQQIDGTLKAGFSVVSRQLGDMGSAMSTKFDLLNNTVLETSKAICDKLDDINETLKNPLFTEARELYKRALQRYIKGFYEEALKDLNEAIKKNETDPFSHFLLGQTYLYGISEFSNVIDLNASIEALRNAAKYITPDAKDHKEARLLAAEIWFYLGLAYQTKANDDLHNSNKTDYEKNINEAKAAYKKSWDYSQKMLESLYNLARCKTLTGDEEGAIKDLITVILIDHGYCIKAFTESDFDSAFKDRVFSQLKRELYPKVKESFDSIQSIKTDFQSPYSENLTKLIKTYLPNTFTEDTPPFDMLEASVNFPEILSILKKERSEYIEKCNEQERKRREEEQRKEQEQQEQKRRAEQEKKNREEQERRDKEDREEKERLKNEEKRTRRNRILLFTLLGLVVGTGISILFMKFLNGVDSAYLEYTFLTICFAGVPILFIIFGIIDRSIGKGILFGIIVDIPIFVLLAILEELGKILPISVCIGVSAIVCAGIGALARLIWD